MILITLFPNISKNARPVFLWDKFKICPQLITEIEHELEMLKCKT